MASARIWLGPSTGSKGPVHAGRSWGSTRTSEVVSGRKRHFLAINPV